MGRSGLLGRDAAVAGCRYSFLDLSPAVFCKRSALSRVIFASRAFLAGSASDMILASAADQF